MTIHSARIAEQLDGGTTWDPDAASAAAERRRDDGQAIGALIGIVNPAAGAAFAALSTLSGSAPATQADPTHPDPVLQVAWSEGDVARRIISARKEDNVRPVFDYSFLVRASHARGAGVNVMVFDDDGDGLDRPLIGEVAIPHAALQRVLDSGDTTELELGDGELRELVVRIQPVRSGEVLFDRTYEVPLRDGLAAIEVAPAGALVSVTASGAGTIGAGFACRGQVGVWGVPGSGCRQYNLRVGDLPEAPHGSAVVLTERSPSLSGFSLADYGDDTACAYFVKGSTGTVVLGVNDNDYGNNTGAFTFDVVYSVPPDGSDELEWGRASPCNPDEGY